MLQNYVMKIPGKPKEKVDFYWFGYPHPADAPPLPEGAEAGWFYIVVNDGFCLKTVPGPNFHIPIPDMWTKQRSNATYVGREKVDGRWADHYRLRDYMPDHDPPCDGMMHIWQDPDGFGLPIMDHGPTD